MPILRAAVFVLVLPAVPYGGAAMTNTPAGAGPASAQPCSRERRAVSQVPVAAEPPARIRVDPPVPSELAMGRTVIAYCADNLLIRPVFGEAALGVSPRIGHIHVTVDGGPMRWVDAVAPDGPRVHGRRTSMKRGR